MDIRRLLSELGIPSYNPDEWRLFIDSSKARFKCVLRNSSLHGSIAIGHSMTAKENCEAKRKVLEFIHYVDHK